MSTTTTIPVYALDPTGTLAANKITNEIQILTPTNWRNYLMIVPKFAPYFMDSLKLVYRGTDGIVKVLTRGVDWYEGHQYIGASRACAKPIYGSIVFMNNQLQGTVTLEYRTLGGEYCIDEARTLEILANTLYNPRTSTWDAVSGIPEVFPVINHEWDLVDMVGMGDLVASMQRIEDEMRQSGQTGLSDHIANKGNPHAVTKTQVGLGSVADYPPATKAQAEAGAADNLYLTPLSGSYLLQALLGNEYDAHVAASNPHGTSAHDVGTYTTAEINQLLSAKLGRTEVAFDSNRFAGMLPADYAAQVLTGTAYNAERIAGRTYLELVQDAQGGAASNAMQLDGKTLEQVKEYVLGSGTAYDSARFGGITYADFWTAIANSTVAGANKVGGKTYAQIVSDITGGTVNNAMNLNGKNELALTTAILSGTAANATKFGGYTVSQFTTMMAGVTVDNANHVGGMTVNELINYIGENAAVQNAVTVGGLSAQDLKNYTDTQITKKIADHDLILQDQIRTLTTSSITNTVAISGLNTTVTSLNTRVGAVETQLANINSVNQQQTNAISELTDTLAQMNADIIAALDSMAAQINTIVTNQ